MTKLQEAVTFLLFTLWRWSKNEKYSIFIILLHSVIHTVPTCKGEPEFSFVGCIENYGKIDVSHAKNFGERKSTLNMNIRLEMAQTDPNWHFDQTVLLKNDFSKKN